METIIMIAVGAIIAGLLPAIVFRKIVCGIEEEEPQLDATESSIEYDTRDHVEQYKIDVKLNRIEVDMLKKAIEKAEGNRAKAARLLGISSRSLMYRLSKHKLSNDV